MRLTDGRNVLSRLDSPDLLIIGSLSRDCVVVRRQLPNVLTWFGLSGQVGLPLKAMLNAPCNTLRRVSFTTVVYRLWNAT